MDNKPEVMNTRKPNAIKGGWNWNKALDELALVCAPHAIKDDQAKDEINISALTLIMTLFIENVDQCLSWLDNHFIINI